MEKLKSLLDHIENDDTIICDESMFDSRIKLRKLVDNKKFNRRKKFNINDHVFKDLEGIK